MSYKRDITDILDEVISAMEFPISIDSVVDNGDGTQTLSCSDIYHAQKGFNVTINGLSYKITDFDQSNETITVKPNFTGSATISSGISFYLYNPFFFHGTPIATGQDLGEYSDANNKTPMVWLWENYTEKNNDSLASISREVSVELYFLTQADFEKWNTADSYSLAIRPMRRLMERFIEEVRLRDDLFSADDLTYDSENYAKFGVFIRTKGATSNLFQDKLSGCSCILTLKLWDKTECSNATVPTFGIGSMEIGQNFIVQ